MNIFLVHPLDCVHSIIICIVTTIIIKMAIIQTNGAFTVSLIIKRLCCFRNVGYSVRLRSKVFKTKRTTNFSEFCTVTMPSSQRTNTQDKFRYFCWHPTRNHNNTANPIPFFKKTSLMYTSCSTNHINNIFYMNYYAFKTFSFSLIQYLNPFLFSCSIIYFHLRSTKNSREITIIYFGNNSELFAVV